MKARETYAMLAAAFLAVAGAFALVVAARLDFTTYRPQPSVAILDTLPETPHAIAFAIDGKRASRRRYTVGNTTLELSGWAYDRRTMTPFLGGAVLVDGHPERLVYGTARDAVAERAGSPSLVRTGWYVRFPPHSVKPGVHTLTFAFVCSDGARVDVADDVATIAGGPPVTESSR